MSNLIPKYRKQIRKNKVDLAFVVIKGQRYHLGNYNSPVSIEKYQQYLASYHVNGGHASVSVDELLIVELIDRFWHHAKTHYRHPDGSPTSQNSVYKIALKPLVSIYGNLKVNEFSHCDS